MGGALRYRALKGFDRIAKVWHKGTWLLIVEEIIEIIDAMNELPPAVKPADGRVKRVLRTRAGLPKRSIRCQDKVKRCVPAELRIMPLSSEVRTSNEVLRAAWRRW